MCPYVAVSVNAGAHVARKPAGISGSMTAARSLYGGIANFVGTSVIHIDHFMHSMVELGHSTSRKFRRKIHPFAGLLAALRISHRFKDCFSQSKEMTLRAWYLMHLEGDVILERFQRNTLANQIAKHTFDMAAETSANYFGMLELSPTWHFLFFAGCCNP